MKSQDKHFHAWVLRIDNNHLGFYAMQGSYTNDITCRRHALMQVRGDPNKIIIMICRSQETCPSNYAPAELTTYQPPGTPQSHYSPTTGEWDGQLPLPQIATSVPTPNWPDIPERITWTRAVTRAYKLPPSQASVLNQIANRDDRVHGCTASMRTLSLDTGFNEKTVRKALQALNEKQLILAHHRPGKTKIIGLPIKNSQLPWP